MKHAILGMGAVGGLLAAILASADEDVTGIVRTAESNAQTAVFELSRPDGSGLRGPVRTAAALTARDRCDILWIATKAYDLDAALQRIHKPAARAVIPLLNGVEHVAHLRPIFGHDRVMPATIAVEAQRAGRTVVQQKSPFVRLVLTGRARALVEPIAGPLEQRAVTLEFEDDEPTLLWNKLVFLAPFALVTSASGLSAGAIREDAYWRDAFIEAAEEVASVARAEGATTNSRTAIAMLDRVAPGMTSSLFRDLQSGHKPELDAIAGDPIRAAERHGVQMPVLRRLQDELRTVR